MSLAKRDEILQVIHTLANRSLQGKERPVRLAIIALLCGGHLLLEDLPGLGKTTLALALAGSLNLSFGRVQCTSDLLPADITGLSVYDRQESGFRFVAGPVFTNILLVDEINRAMPKTQSALLEAMEERRVTVDGVTHPLPEPFLVIATQNPAEQVGTYPLPESQMDRFLIRTGLGYPPAGIEREIIRTGSIRDELLRLTPLISGADILAARGAVADSVYLGDKLADYIYRLVAATRSHPLLQTGISTRGAISLAEAAKAQAFLAGRTYVIPEDVKELAEPVTAHRLVFRAENEALSKEEVLRALMDELPVPLS